MADEFFMMLPSNVIDAQFPNNKTSDYYTTLPEVMHLEGTWLVALAEVHIPQTWYTIHQERALIKFDVYLKKDPSRYRRYTFRFPSGYYQPRGICTFNEWLSRVVNPSVNTTRLIFDEVSRKFSVNLYRRCRIQIEKPLSDALGFVVSNGFRNESVNDMQITAPYVADLELHQIFIYLSCMKDCLVGNQYTNLLRIVFPTGK